MLSTRFPFVVFRARSVLSGHRSSPTRAIIAVGVFLCVHDAPTNLQLGYFRREFFGDSRRHRLRHSLVPGELFWIVPKQSD